MKRVIVRGPALSRTGYGEHCRFVLRALRKHESRFDIFLLPTTWGQGGGWSAERDEEAEWILSLIGKTQQALANPPVSFDLSVQVTVPNEFERMAPYNVLVTAGVETTKIPAQWADKCNQADKIIVPSQFTKEVIESSQWDATIPGTEQSVKVKVATPVEAVPYPARPLEAEVIPETFSAPFNFLVIAQWCPRKNLENTIKWFVEEFHNDEDVGLVLKIMIRNNSRVDREYVQSNIRKFLSQFPDRKCKVTLLHGELTDEQMAGLYRHPQIKAFVNLARGEGYGLPLFEAAQAALPIVALGWGGHVDFLYYEKRKKKRGSKKSRKVHVPGYETVNYRIQPVEREAIIPGLIEEGTQWAFANEPSAKGAMRRCVEDEASCRKRAETLAQRILSDFSEVKTLDKMADAIYVESEAEADWAAKVEMIETL
jgi:hypothetical protein